MHPPSTVVKLRKGSIKKGGKLTNVSLGMYVYAAYGEMLGFSQRYFD